MCANMDRTEEMGMIYLQLFFSFLQVGLFSFGGGYAAMPLIQEQIVTKHAWLSMVEFTDLISISQMTPGPIAVNSATFVGNKIAGVGGALIATIGCILPSCIIVTSIAYVYLKNRENQVVQEVLQSLHPAVIAMIASASNTDWSMVVIFAISLFLLRKTCISPILVMILAGGMKLFTSMLL